MKPNWIASFPVNQFKIEGYKTPYRLDISQNKGGIMAYINENIPSRRLMKTTIPRDIQIIPFEINIRKRKWLILAIYKPPNQNHDYFLCQLKIVLDTYLCLYQDFILIGDFNLQPHDTILKNFLESYNCVNLIRSPTCYKSLSNPSCIDLIITNRKMCFSTYH